MRRPLLSLLLFHISFLVFGQNALPESEGSNDFNNALALAQTGLYLPSRSLFERYLKAHPHHYRSKEAEYYIAFNAINAKQKDGERLMNRFVASNPAHPQALFAYFELGNYYFQQGSYGKALQYYSKVDFSALPDALTHEGRFRQGYSNFTLKEKEAALQLFDMIPQSDYYADAKYYTGVIYYESGNYQMALNALLEAGKEQEYQDVVAEMVGASYLALREYDNLIGYINGLGPVKLQNSIQLLKAEAYFYKKDYIQAATQYELALSNNRNKTSPLIYYHQGYAHYQAGSEQPAIEAFKLAALSADTIGQYGAYYLGVLYTKTGNRQYALNAFENASNAGFNPTLQEEAAFRVGQLHYELGQYAQSIHQLKQFAASYPHSTFTPTARELLSDAYLKTHNYDIAINYIESLRQRSPAIDQVYQQVTLLKGIQLFNDSQFPASITLFNKSLSTPVNPQFTAQANFRKGEAYSIGKKWPEAIEAYGRVVFNRKNTSYPCYLKSRYGLGYAHYNNKSYDKAKFQFAAFTRALNGSYDQPSYLDALTRLGDCYFVEKRYQDAVNNYENALRGRSRNQAYIYLQLGLSYGFQDNIKEARKNFEHVLTSHKATREAERAAYQMALLDFERGNFAEAVKTFSLLIEAYPDSKMIPHALVKRGVSNFNLEQYNHTIADYQKVLDNYMTHEAANSALLGLQEVAAASGAEVDLEGYIEKYRQANPNDKSLERVEFEAAKSSYFNQDYPGAVTKFTAFHDNYPTSSLKGEALYFIADSYYRSDQYEQALNYFYQVLQYPQVSYFNRSVHRIANLEFKAENYPKAIIHYHLLRNKAQHKRENYNSMKGLMHTHEKLGNTDSVKWYANHILQQEQVASIRSSTANLALGKAAIAEEQYEEAVQLLQLTMEVADDENAAEAAYLTGMVYHLQGLHDKSNTILFTMTGKYSFYEYWIGKSFLLIADNYFKTNELFQAKATLKSIIEKSPIPEIVNSAKAQLAIVEESEGELLQKQPLPEDTLKQDGNENK